MIFDSHAHVAAKGMMHPQFLEEMLQPFYRAAGRPIPPEVYDGIDPDAMMQEYRDAGVDKVCLFGVAQPVKHMVGRDPCNRHLGNAIVPNEYVAEICRRHPDLTLLVAGIDPAHQGGEAAAEEVEYVVKELGASAIKVWPTYNHYRVDDREDSWPVYRKALELGVPVIIHQSWTTTVHAPMEFQRPIHVDNIAREFRDLTIIMAHFGVPWVDEAMCVIAKHDNVYADMSFWSQVERPEIILQQLIRAHRYGCTYDRLLWATDYPLTTPAESLRVMREDLAEAAERTGWPMVPQEGLEAMLGKNAARIFGLADYGAGIPDAAQPPAAV